MPTTLRDLTDGRPRTEPSPDQETYTTEVEKTNVILPVDRAGILATPGRLASRSRSYLAHFLSILGPGVITGASDDDPSGIGTYSVAGAQFGYRTLWLAIVTYPLSAAVQEVCARIGLVTGHGLAAVTKKHYGRPLLAMVALLLFVANTVNIGADLQAMTATIQLVVPGLNFALTAVSLTVIILLFLIFVSYKVYARYLKIVSMVLFSYVLVAFLAHVDWASALHSFLLPSFSLDHRYLMTLVGILGTTISPYMFFWQANEEVEEEIAHGVIRKDGPETNHHSLLHIDRRIIKNMYIDVNVGMFYSELIMFFIILATASTIFKAGTVTDVTSLGLDQLANVLRPLVGDFAFKLFTVGIVGIGLLAIPVLAGSASYAIAELFSWQEGLNKKFQEAKGFYVVIILATFLGLALNFTNISPVAALYYSAVLNGIIAVPLLIVIWRIGNNRKILGEHTSGWLSNLLVGITVTFMSLAALAMGLLR